MAAAAPGASLASIARKASRKAFPARRTALSSLLATTISPDILVGRQSPVNTLSVCLVCLVFAFFGVLLNGRLDFHREGARTREENAKDFISICRDSIIALPREPFAPFASSRLVRAQFHRKGAKCAKGSRGTL